jgi:hypothetical protein
VAKRLDIGDKSYRKRRGKWVKIPEEWVGIDVSSQTKRKRDSKKTRKQRNTEWPRALRRTIPGEDYGGRSLTMDMLKHKQGDYLDEEIDDGTT